MRFKFAIALTIIGLLVACGEQSTSPMATPLATLSPQAQQGKQLLSQECASCHSLVEDAILVGPSLSEIVTRAQQQFPDQEARIYI